MPAPGLAARGLGAAQVLAAPADEVPTVPHAYGDAGTVSPRLDRLASYPADDRWKIDPPAEAR